MRKLLTTAILLASVAAVQAATVTLNWIAPAPVAPNPTDLVAIQIWDFPPSTTSPSVNTMIGSVGPAVRTFTTTALVPGVHQFTAVAVYGECSAPPSNVVSQTIVVVLAPVTNLTGTINP